MSGGANKTGVLRIKRPGNYPVRIATKTVHPLYHECTDNIGYFRNPAKQQTKHIHPKLSYFLRNCRRI